MTRRNISFARGDSYPFQIAITNAGSAVDLTGAQFRMTAKYAYQDTDGNAVFSLTSPQYIVITDAANGRLAITIPPSATSGLGPREYRLVYDIQMYDSSQSISTVCSGILNVFPDVSQTAP